MKSRLGSFNIYLCAAAVFLGAGCGSIHLSGKKEYTFLQVYLEARNGAATGAQMVKVLNIPMYVEPRPFLTEVDVTQAKLVEAPDGTYAVQVMFTDEGSLELDMTSSSSKQLNLVIYTLYPQPGGKESKSGDVFAAEKTSPGQTRVSSWTAAPIVSNLSSGTLEFTPVVTHAEAERIVRGLNNMAADLKTGRR